MAPDRLEAGRQAVRLLDAKRHRGRAEEGRPGAGCRESGAEGGFIDLSPSVWLLSVYGQTHGRAKIKPQPLAPQTQHKHTVDTLAVIFPAGGGDSQLEVFLEAPSSQRLQAGWRAASGTMGVSPRGPGGKGG